MAENIEKSKSKTIIGLIFAVVSLIFIIGLIFSLKNYSRYKSIQDRAVEIVLSSTKRYDEIKDDHNWLLDRLYFKYSGKDDSLNSSVFGNSNDSKAAYNIRTEELNALADILISEGFELTDYEANTATAEFFHYTNYFDFMLHHIDGQPLLIVEACSLFALIVLATCLIVIQKHKKEVKTNVHDQLPRV